MKQTIEIEVPDGKKAVWKDGRIEFINVETWRDITTFDQALAHVSKCAHYGSEAAQTLINEYNLANTGTYSETVSKYRIVVFALTNNEKRHLTTGERWFPTIEFCIPGKVKNCYGNIVVGRIRSEGQEYEVVGGSAIGGASAGLGGFYSSDGVSIAWTGIGFRSVSGKEIAQHISKYFGKLLFEVQYGGVNCDWEWIR